MVLTGEDDEDMSYMALNDGPYAIPPSNKRAITDATPFSPFGPGSGGSCGGASGGGASGFKPVYD